MPDGVKREPFLECSIWGTKEGSGMAGGEHAVTHVALNTRRELEETEGVRDRGPGFADPVCHLVVSEIEVFDELLVRCRFIERVQILALQVLDERLLQAGDVIDLSDDGGDRRETGTAGSPVAALSSDDLVLARAELPNQNRLENTDRLDRIDE
jgi:hypothetical protein